MVWVLISNSGTIAVALIFANPWMGGVMSLAHPRLGSLFAVGSFQFTGLRVRSAIVGLILGRFLFTVSCAGL